MTAPRERLEKNLMNRSFVRYKEGADMYSLGLSKFTTMAREARAVIKCDKVVLVDRIAFEEYLESFRE